MNPLGTRGRAQELADLLDSALGAPRAAVSGPLSSYVGIAARLQTVGAGVDARVSPRPEFRDQLRTRLMAVAAVQEHSAPARAALEQRSQTRAVSWATGRKAQRGMGVAVGAMASVVAVTGVAVAGTQSLPGDPFYGVKKGVEAFQLRTADGDVGKGSKHLDLAGERLSEVRALALGRDAALTPVGSSVRTGVSDPVAAAGVALGSSAAERIRQALVDMDESTREGSTLLTEAFRDTSSDVPLQILTRFAGGQSTELRELLPALPAAVRERAETSLSYVSEVGAEASALLAVGVCTGLCAPPSAPPALPPASGQPQPQPQTSASQAPAPCGCQTPAPAPSSSAPPAQPSQAPTPDPEPSSSPTPAPSPKPSASSSPAPLPVPVPVPVPSLPVPIPTLPAPIPTLPAPIPTGAPQAGGPGTELPGGLLAGGLFPAGLFVSAAEELPALLRALADADLADGSLGGTPSSPEAPAAPASSSSSGDSLSSSGSSGNSVSSSRDSRSAPAADAAATPGLHTAS